LDKEDLVVRGVPNGMQEQVSEVLLEITPDHRIVRIILEGTDDAVTEYRLTGQKENVAVADERFRFEPPSGVETIEGDLGQ
jgi:outer membrane lipoprotein-sorting protein